MQTASLSSSRATEAALLPCLASERVWLRLLGYIRFGFFLLVLSASTSSFCLAATALRDFATLSKSGVLTEVILDPIKPDQMWRRY